jgi:hypothetical protein
MVRTAHGGPKELARVVLCFDADRQQADVAHSNMRECFELVTSS